MSLPRCRWKNDDVPGSPTLTSSPSFLKKTEKKKSVIDILKRKKEDKPKDAGTEEIQEEERRRRIAEFAEQERKLLEERERVENEMRVMMMRGCDADSDTIAETRLGEDTGASEEDEGGGEGKIQGKCGGKFPRTFQAGGEAATCQATETFQHESEPGVIYNETGGTVYNETGFTIYNEPRTSDHGHTRDSIYNEPRSFDRRRTRDPIYNEPRSHHHHRRI